MDITDMLENELQLVCVKNPFQRAERETSILPYDGQTLADIVTKNIPNEINVWVSINGQITHKDVWHLTYPQVGDQIVVVPIVAGGESDKQILGIILMIAVIWAAPHIVGIIAPGLAEGTLAYMFAVAGVMVAGGLLIQSLLPSPQPKSPDFEEISQVYGWNPQTTQRQGLVVPAFYGLNKLYGNIVAVHTEVTESYDAQTLKMLVCLGGGPIESVSDIKLNDQPVANFVDVTTETKLGLVNQTIVSFFGESKPEYRPNIKVINGTPITYSTPNDNFDDIEIDIIFARGIYHANNQGGLSNHSIDIKVEISEYQENDWTTIIDTTITDNTTSRLWRTYTASDQMVITNGKKYDIRVTKGTADKGVRYGDDVYIGSVREILNDDFNYPLTALVGISALATDQLSGSMRFSCLSEGKIIDTYNGTSWTLQYSNNPAWVLYNILTQPIISGNGGGTPYAIERYDGINPSRIDYAKFYELAIFCDQADIPDGKGGTEKRITFNGGFDVGTTMWEAALKVCEIARCVLIWNGIELTLAIDKTASPVQMFTIGDIIKNSFVETFLPEKDRASEIELRYRDADQDYRLVPFTIFNSAINNPANKVTLELFGITKQSEAWRAGMFRLAQNQLLKTTIEFEVDVNAIACTVGDVIYVQHDVPEWGEGGRVISATDSTITIDREVSPTSDVNQIMVKIADDSIETKTVISISNNGGQSVLTISGTWTTNPSRDDIYTYGVQNLVAKQFRIVGFEKTGDQRCRIKAIEYDANVYANDPLSPVLPAAGITPSESDNILRPPNWENVINRIPLSVLGAMTTDSPFTTNLAWSDDDPDGNSVAWEADDGTNPILLTYKGTTYEITADNTNKKYIYWDSASTTVFLSTDTLSAAVGPDKWLMCENDAGTSYPTPPGKVIHGGIIQANTITAAFGQIADLAVGTANIANLNVTTGKIANNATRILEAWYAAGETSYISTGYSSLTDNLSIASAGNVIIIKGSCVAHNYDAVPRTLEFQIYKDGVGSQYSVTQTIPAGEDLSFVAEVTQTPGAGTQTYRLRGSAEVANKIKAKYRSIVLDEPKGK